MRQQRIPVRHRDDHGCRRHDRASNGTPTNVSQASANVGQVIELVGTNFGDATRVLFNTRDQYGSTGVISVDPLAINAAGTRLQVMVPDLASTGELRVVNGGSRNLGFSSYNDAIHRDVTLSFVAGNATAVVRFADGGLQDLSDESWGIDNVVVKQGVTTVFADDFEGAAAANWSDATTDSSTRGVFSEFSGRFNNAARP